MVTRIAASRSAPRFLGSSVFASAAALSAAALSAAAVSAGSRVSAGSSVCSPAESSASADPVTASEKSARCLPPRRSLTQDQPAAGDDVDGVDVRRRHGEGPLDANAVAFLAHGEGLADPAALPAKDDTLEHLDAFLGALDDLDMHVDG